MKQPSSSHVARFARVSCRKEIALRKEKNREPLLEERLPSVTESMPAVPPGEMRPLVAKDPVAGLCPAQRGARAAGLQLTGCLSPALCGRVLGAPGAESVCPLHGPGSPR